MEEFYPFRSEDIPELHQLVEDRLIDKDRGGLLTKDEAISFLLPLVIDLLDNAGKSRALKNAFLVEYGGYNLPKIGDGFWKIVEAYLEENNGTGNLLRIMEVLNANDHEKIANCLDKFLVRYSLPASSGGSELSDAIRYSLSRDFLQAEKKDVAGDSVSVWNANSMEQALHNSVIMEEILKKLHIGDQKLFRLVCPSWMEEAFSFWRRNARIIIHVSRKEEKHNAGISLNSFMDLWEISKKAMDEAKAKENVEQGRPASEDIENYKLLDNPFHCFKVRYQESWNLLSSGKMEEKFWQVCGDHIEDLKIIGPSRHSYDYYSHLKARLTEFPCSSNSTIKNCKRLLQDTCQNLKRLEISGGFCCRGASNSEKEKINENDEVKLGNAEVMKMAKKLRALKVGDVDEESFRSLLFICPNLKELTISEEYDLLLGALLSPVANREFIKLEKLVLREHNYISDDFISLRQYFEMLAKNKFDSFKHFELSTLLCNARSAPFNLYAALAQVSKDLKTLELELILCDNDELEENPESEWFMDLSPFAFPNLTELNLFINFEDVHEDFEINPFFDFGTLKGMPMLEKLEIRTKNPGRAMILVRQAGAQDWVFEGDRNRYLPTGVVVDYQYSAEDLILCSKLKEFTFIGWSLTKEDIGLLSGWFPNLTYLRAEVNDEALPLLVENWKHLEKLVLRTEKLISLRKLRPLKEEKNHLRIFQRILTGKKVVDENDDNLLELKECNGRLFFPI